MRVRARCRSDAAAAQAGVREVTSRLESLRCAQKLGLACDRVHFHQGKALMLELVWTLGATRGDQRNRRPLGLISTTPAFPTRAFRL